MQEPSPIGLLALKVIHPVCETEHAALPFVHALKLAVASKGELEIVDLRGKDQDNIGVRLYLEKWGLLPNGSHRADVKSIGLKVTKIVKHGNEKKEMARRMEKNNHDLLVIATKPHANTVHFFGQDLTEYLTTHFRKTTLYVPENARPFVDRETGNIKLNNILMPLTPAPSSECAFNLLHRLLAFFPELKPEIFGFHCGNKFPDVPESFLRGLSLSRKLSLEPIVAGISAMTREHAIDLIIMATNGRDSLGKKILGSITEQVLRCAPCPVLSVPAQS